LYHHRQPFAAGGTLTVENIDLRCLPTEARSAKVGPRAQCPPDHGASGWLFDSAAMAGMLR
jgi:hypothetical protein